MNVGSSTNNPGFDSYRQIIFYTGRISSSAVISNPRNRVAIFAGRICYFITPPRFIIGEYRKGDIRMFIQRKNIVVFSNPNI